MKSDVDVTFGFSLWILVTGTPVFAEMTPKVSPALTLQYSLLFAVVETCGDGGMLALVVVVVLGFGAVLEARATRATATVTASRNAAGATYRRQSSRRHYQPDAAQISFFSRAASAPAASR